MLTFLVFVILLYAVPVYIARKIIRILYSDIGYFSNSKVGFDCIIMCIIPIVNIIFVLSNLSIDELYNQEYLKRNPKKSFSEKIANKFFNINK